MAILNTLKSYTLKTQFITHFKAKQNQFFNSLHNEPCQYRSHHLSLGLCELTKAQDRLARFSTKPSGPGLWWAQKDRGGGDVSLNIVVQINGSCGRKTQIGWEIVHNKIYPTRVGAKTDLSVEIICAWPPISQVNILSTMDTCRCRVPCMMSFLAFTLSVAAAPVGIRGRHARWSRRK